MTIFLSLITSPIAGRSPGPDEQVSNVSTSASTWSARRVFDHHLGQSDDGIERRAQLMAHARDKLRLVLARLRQLPVLVWISSNRRTFSMAITAWSAKVETSSICLSVNGRTEARLKTITPTGFPSRSSGTPSIV